MNSCASSFRQVIPRASRGSSASWICPAPRSRSSLSPARRMGRRPGVDAGREAVAVFDGAVVWLREGRVLHPSP